MYSVILTELSTKSDLRAVVGAISNVLNIDKRAAVERAKNLPLILAENLQEKEAMLMANMFKGMGAEVKCEQKAEYEIVSEAESENENETENEAESEEYEESKFERRRNAEKTFHKKNGTNFGCLAFLMVSLVAFAVFASLKHEQIIEFAIKQFKPNPVKSEKLLQKGKMSEARQSIKKQLAEKPNDVELLVLQGKFFIGAARKKMNAEKWKTYGEAGALPELDSALSFFRKAESMNPKDGKVPRWISIAEQMRRDLPNAETAARRAVSIDPQDVDNWNQLGSVLVDQEQISQAEKAFYQVQKLDPNNAAALKNLAILNLYYTKDAERAASFLFAFLQQKEASTDMDAHMLRTDLTTAMIGDFNPPLERLGPPTLPFEEYEKRRSQIAANPQLKSDPLLQEQLGLVYMSRGYMSAAELNFIGAINLNPNIESSRKMLAIIYMKEESYEKALRIMQAAADNGAKDPFFWKNIGVLQKYYKANFAEAKKAFNRYFALGGDSFENRIRKEMR